MIYRIDVRTAPASRGGEAAVDPLGQAVRHQIQELGINVGPVATFRIFLIDTSASRQQVEQAAGKLLADPIVEQAVLFDGDSKLSRYSRIEIHLKPGVMDPVAASTEMALRDLGLAVREVRTGRAYQIDGIVPREQLQRIAERVLANGVIETVHFQAFVPKEFERGREYRFSLRHVPLLGLGETELLKLSRDGHLFLSLAEMQAIQTYFRKLQREPTDIELETLAQTWSEHCVHKTLKSAVDVEVLDESGKVVGTRHYDNLIRDTIFASTRELMGEQARRHEGTKARRHEGTKARSEEICSAGGLADSPPSCLPLSVFSDNAGVIAFDQTHAVCFKVETHNHPSAIEPYGGSATGVGGVIRDILGTGRAAKPIANTDVFCVAAPDTDVAPLPRGVIHPKRVLQQVVAGVRDYGNRMGIPTVNGAVYFDDRYLGNPLVFCGCVGLIPRDKIRKSVGAGDAIVLMGGRTGRDGIHGATFSSAELTDTHADEFSHAVQIGNAITEKKVADVLLAARDRDLFTAVTDCGAGGLSSAVGEMAQELGAVVELDKVPLKYAGLRYDEIWISEAQERMVLSVREDRLRELLGLAAAEDVEATVIGRFGTERHELVLKFKEQEVGRLSMDFLHHGLPMARRSAIVRGRALQAVKHGPQAHAAIKQRLLALLAQPNIASKHWIIRQYDHEVQGGSVIKPLTGPLQLGPSDGAVIRPKLSSYRGVALGCGLAPHLADPYVMAVASIDEAIRNVVAVGADPAQVALLDNFCWPSVEDEETMGSLVQACEACRDAALAYGTPFISGKDSLHNQFTNSETGQVIRIPNTLLISAIGVIEDVRRCVTMNFKSPGRRVFLVRAKDPSDLKQLRTLHGTVAALIAQGSIASCHDVSDGGVLVAAAEMAIASGIGLRVSPDGDPFDESPGQYLMEEVNEATGAAVISRCRDAGVECTVFGETMSEPLLVLADRQEVQVAAMRDGWRGTFDW